jgi:MinD-like ATPase involved in chromosome partitioning or flagellar assembly
MSLVTVVSAKGSPGATTIALLLARELACRRQAQVPGACLVDADPDGGDLALRLGLDPVPGAATLALAGRHGFDDSLLVAHAQNTHSLPGVAIVPGVAGRAQRSVIEWLAGPLARAAAAMSLPVVVDAGRVGTMTSRSLFEASDCVLVACRSDTASIVHARSALVSLAAEGIDAKAVLTEGSGESAHEVASALGHPVAAVVPLDTMHSPLLAQPSRRLSSSALRHLGRSSDPAVQLLASVVLGEAPSIALPTARILEVPPPHVSTAATRAGLRSGSR